MTTPLRIDVEDGSYHVSARGIGRREIFGGGRNSEHSLELLDRRQVYFPSETRRVLLCDGLLRSPQHTLYPKLRRLLPRPFRRGWGEGLLGVVYPAVLAVGRESVRAPTASTRRREPAAHDARMLL